MYFRFILAPFCWWSISFPDILDFYKASEDSSYFSSLAFAICELSKRLDVPWSETQPIFPDCTLPMRLAYRVGYYVGVFSSLFNRARWYSFAFCWSENAIEKNMHKQLGLTKYIERIFLLNLLVGQL